MGEDGIPLFDYYPTGALFDCNESHGDSIRLIKPGTRAGDFIALTAIRIYTMSNHCSEYVSVGGGPDFS